MSHRKCTSNSEIESQCNHRDQIANAVACSLLQAPKNHDDNFCNINTLIIHPSPICSRQIFYICLFYQLHVGAKGWLVRSCLLRIGVIKVYYMYLNTRLPFIAEGAITGWSGQTVIPLSSWGCGRPHWVVQIKTTSPTSHEHNSTGTKFKSGRRRNE